MDGLNSDTRSQFKTLYISLMERSTNGRKVREVTFKDGLKLHPFDATINSSEDEEERNLPGIL